MRIQKLNSAGPSYEYQWPSGNVEKYRAWVDYTAKAPDGIHQIRIGFGTRSLWGVDRERVVVWIDNQPQVEFFGADDFNISGDVLSDIWLKSEETELICRYPEDAIPERYISFNVIGLPTRVDAKGVRNSWAVVSSIADHETMVSLASLRRQERI